MNWKNYSNAKKFLIIGFLFGLSFPIFSTLFELYIDNKNIDSNSILEIQKIDKLLWVIDTAPIILGLLAFYLGIKQDEVTKLKNKLKLNLDDLEKKFSVVFKNGDFGILIFNWETKIYENINPFFCKMLGYSPEEIQSLGIENLTSLEDLQKEKDSFQRISNLNEGFVLQKSFIHKNGNIIWCKSSYSLIKDSENSLKYIFIFVDDISKEKFANEELISQQNFIRQVIDLSPDLIFVKDADGRFILVNQAMASTFGKPISEIENRLNSEFHENDIEMNNYITIDKLVLEKNYIIVQEETFTKKDNTALLFKTTKLRIQDAVGKKYVLGFAKNITAEKDLQTNLINAKNSAEQANKMKSEFLANMSHEIRTPLNGILGMAQILSETKLDSEQIDLVQTIKSSGDSLLVILNDILDYSKIEAGKIELELNDFNLDNCIKEIHSLFSYNAKQKKLIFEYSIDGNIPPNLIGDQFRLRQILLNLIGNSFKFTTNGSIKIEASLKNNFYNKVEIKFKIIDTGTGIEKDKIGKLFQSFSQVDSSISRKFGGTGLGLAISSKLAKLMGGELIVESEIGKGSTFEFSIYFEVGENLSKINTPISSNFTIPTDIRILVADDNEINQKIILRIFKNLNIDIQIANNGLEVLEKLKTEKFDIIFMDMQMPVLDGIEATKRIRLIPEYNSIYIIALTANAMSTDKELCISVGMNSFLSKPFKVEDIKNEISKTYS